MARTVQQIYNQIKAQKNAESSLAGLNSPSNVAIYNLWMWLTAVSIALLEQVIDIYKAAIEDSIAKAGAGTLPWLRDRILEFQSGYNVEYNNGVIVYPIIDPSAKIISRCSISQDGNRLVTARVAKQNPPVALSITELTELRFYGKQFQFAGTQLIFKSENPDQLYISGIVEYDGQFSGVIKDTVVSALNLYCQNLSSDENFGGYVTVNDIENAIESVQGVKNVKLNVVQLRADSQSFGSGTTIYNLSSGTNIIKTQTEAGYAIGETTSGNTFNDTFTYNAV